MSEIVPRRDSFVTPFAPEHTKRRQKLADNMIRAVASEWASAEDEGERVLLWEMLEDAVERKLQDQARFLGWWHDNVDRPGGDYKAKSRDRGILSVQEAQGRTGITDNRVSRWRTKHKDIAKFRQQQIDAARRKAELEAAANHRAEGTGENEWFTPVEYIEAARDVLGEIDLDPATHPLAQETIQATKFFTRKDDGLSKLWHGRVWLNPPYAQPDIGYFATKMVEEVTAKRVSEAIMLTHNYTDTVWFHTAASIASAICFTRGRIKFVDIDGEICAPTQGQAFFYYGHNQLKFCSVFAAYGLLVIPARGSFVAEDEEE